MQKSEQNNEPGSAPHVIQAIGMMTELLAKEGVSKDKTAKAGGDGTYKFRGIDDIRNVIAPLQKQCSLIILPCVTGRAETQRTTSNGKFALHVVVKIDFHFVSTKDGSEVIVPMENEAVDYSDKATNKAISQAYKTVCINTFNIPTEGEEDTDADKVKDLRGTKRMVHESREVCDKFVEDYIRAVTGAETRHALRDIGAVHAATITSMQASEDDHERLMAAMCKTKHEEALSELKSKEAQAPKPPTVDGLMAKTKAGGAA